VLTESTWTYRGLLEQRSSEVGWSLQSKEQRVQGIKQAIDPNPENRMILFEAGPAILTKPPSDVRIILHPVRNIRMEIGTGEMIRNLDRVRKAVG